MKKKLSLLILAVLVLIVATFTGCNGTSTENKVSSVSMFTAFDKVTYVQGESLDLSGAQIQVVYEDNTYDVIPVTPEMVSSFDSTVLGEQLLRISYKGQGCTVPVTVVKSSVLGMSIIKEKPQNYIVEQNINYDEVSIKVEYTNGTSEIYPITADMCSDFDMKLVGEQQVHVVLLIDDAKYDIYYDISVREKTLIGIEVSEAPTKEIYYVGDAELDLTDGILFLQYDNGYPQKVKMSELIGLESSWDSTTVTDAGVVSLTYGGLSTSFYVQIKVKDVLEYEELSLPTHKQLIQTDLDLTGLSLKLTYNNYKTETITFPAPGAVYVEGYDRTKVGYQTLILHFLAGTTMMDTTYSLEIYVSDKELTAIDVIPTTDVIYQQTDIDITGWSYVLVYDNGETSEPEALADNMIIRDVHENVYYFETAGKHTWNLRYKNFDYLYEFDVAPLEVVDIQITSKQPATVYLGHDLDVTGITLKVKYNSGLVKENVPVYTGMVSEFDKDTLGAYKVALNYYDAYTTCFPVELQVVVVKKVVSSLGVEQNPIKTSYTYSEAIDFTGLQIAMTYEGDDEPTIISAFDSDWTFENAEWSDDRKFSTKGTKQIWVTYAGLEYPETQGVMISVEIRNAVMGISLRVPTLGDIIQGNELNYADYTFLISYEDNEQEVVYDSILGKYVAKVGKTTRPLDGVLAFDYDARDLTVEAERLVTISYTEGSESVSCDATVAVLARAPIALEIYRLPNKLEYVFGSGDVTDPTGLVVNLIYNNGTREVMRYGTEDAQVEFTTVDTLEQGGTTLITILYIADESIKVSYEVEIKEAVVTGISWNGNMPIVGLTQGTEYDFTKVCLYDKNTKTITSNRLGDIEVKLAMSSGKTEIKPVSEIADKLSITAYDKFSIGTQTVEVIYGNNPDLLLKATTVILQRTLTGMELYNGLNASNEFKVIEGADIDLSTYYLRLTYDNNARNTDEIPMQKGFITGYDKDHDVPGTKQVNIVYDGQTIYNVNLIINAKKIVSISMNKLPKVKYIESEYMDTDALSSGSIVVYYDNGQTTEIGLTAPDKHLSINMSRFDNTEFSGQSKLQTIFVTYTSDEGDEYETSFDVIMRDRKYLSVSYNASNIYNFTYGDLNAENAPKFIVRGYTSFDSSSRELIFDESKIVIEYVKYEERNNARDPEKDYSVLPTDVGQYIICITYDASAFDDMVHNSLNESTKILTITKKDIYVVIDNIDKVYGTANPSFSIKAYGANASGGMSAEVEPFAFGENFNSVGFCTEKHTKYDTICYFGDGETTDVFEVLVTTALGVVEKNVSEGTAVGNYVLKIGGLTGSNYNIHYVNGTFSINKRQVQVTPFDVSVVYGTIATELTYVTSVVPGVEDSGLYGTDVLSGSPVRMSGRDTGIYPITIGTLNNPNYEIVFDGSKNVTITPRDIYVKVINSSKIYGEELPAFEVSYFKDESCSDADAFAYAMDLPIALGKLTFEYGDLNYLSPVGTYYVSPKITKYQTHEVPEGVTSIYNNYSIHYVDGILEIDRRSVTVVADNKTKAFNDDDPTFTYSVNYSNGSDGVGLVAINLALEMFESLSGSLERISGENVGRYVINIGTLEEENPNYNIQFTQGAMTIISREIIVKLADEDLNKVFDGKIPSVTNYTMYKVTEGEEIYFGNQDDVYENYITINVISPSRNVGSYAVSIETFDTNISVSFPKGVEYRYVITPLVVDVEYVDLPTVGNNEYKKAPYVISARIPEASLQIEYNDDGTPKTDNDNQLLRDSVDVILSRYNATDVGQYSTSAVRLNSNNYELSDAAKQAVEFEIVQRELVIEVYPTDEDLNAIVKEYNGQGVTLNIKEYTVHNAIEGDSLQVIPYVYNPNSTSGTAPKDVFYNSEGQVISYEIRVDQPTDRNYHVSFKDSYYYRITPKDVTITIFSTFLSKTYDGNAPSIVSSNYSISIATLMPSTISFVFTREENDTRSNADVGSYSIDVECTDRNHNVKLSEDFVYTIEKATVTVTVKSTASSKSYDGNTIKYLESDITMSTTPGITPRIRTFANVDDFQESKDALAGMVTTFSSLIKSTSAISFTDLEYAKVLLGTARGDYASAKSLFMLYGDAYFSKTNKDNVNNLFIQLGGSDGNGGYFSEIENAINKSDISGATNALARATNAVTNLYDTVNKENHYLAFIMSGSDSTATAVGVYTYEMQFNDLNKEYNLQNITKRYEITRQNVVLKITGLNDNGADVVYGDVFSPEDVADWETNKLGYEFYNEITFINKLDNILIDGTLTITGIKEAGYASTAGKKGYAITPSSSILNNVNYLVTYNTVYFEIEKKTITIVGDDNVGTTTDPSGAIYYGDSVNNFRLRQWHLKNGGEELVGSDTIAVIDTISAAKFVCDMGTKPKAGTYALKISGFIADNYNFEYEDGLVTINKAPLTIVTDSVGRLNRTYGDGIVLEFTGFKYEDTMASLGSFKQPVPADSTNPGFLLSTDASPTEIYTVSFVIAEEDVNQFENYFIELEPTYSIIVNKALLQLVFYGENGAEELTAEYGSAPIYTMTFEGFKNGESASSLGIDVSSCVEFNLTRSVADSSTPFGDEVTFKKEVVEGPLHNYEYRVKSITYTVTPKKLYVKLDKEISVMYDYNSTTESGSATVEMYVLRTSNSGDNTTASIIAGQYSGTDIKITGFIAGESAETVLNFYSTVVSNEKYSDTKNYTYEYINAAVAHGLDYNASLIGEQDLRLKGLSFKDTVPNYEPVYEATSLTVYSKVMDMTYGSGEDSISVPALTFDGTRVVLNGDDASTITFTTHTESGQTEVFTLGANGTDGISLSYSGLNMSTLNKNQSITITYNRTYNITGYDNSVTSRDIEFVKDDKVQIIHQTISSEIQTTIVNGSVTKSIVVRVLNKYTQDLGKNEMVIQDSGAGAAEPGSQPGFVEDDTQQGETQSEEQILYVNGETLVATDDVPAAIFSKEVAQSDIVYLTVRAERTSNKPNSTVGEIMIVFDGATGERTISIYKTVAVYDQDTGVQTGIQEVFDHNETLCDGYNIKLYSKMMDAENRIFYLSFCGEEKTITENVGGSQQTRTVVDGSVENYYVVLDFGGINLFDGKSHDIKYFHDKRLGEIYISIDGNMAEVITDVPDEYNQDYSELSVSVTGAFDVNVSGIKRMVQGYKDNYATIVRPGTVKNGETNNIDFISRSYFEGIKKDVSTLFETTILKKSTYRKIYYVNGTKIAEQDYQGNIIKGDLKYEFFLGTYRVDLAIVDEADRIISSDYVTAIFSASAKTVSINGDVVTPNTPVNVSGYATEMDISIFSAALDAGLEDTTLLASSTNSLRSRSAVVSKSSEGINSVKSVEMTFGYDNAHILTEDGELDIEAGTYYSYIVLYGTNTTFVTNAPYNPRDKAIAIRIKRTKLGVNTVSYLTELIVVNGNKRYVITIDDSIDWSDGSLYTAGLYLDYMPTSVADPDGKAYILGSRGFSIILSKNGQFLYQAYISSDTADFTIENGGQTSQELGSEFMNSILSGSGNVMVYANDARISVYNVSFNSAANIRNDYMDGSGEYHLADVENGNTVDASSTFTLAANYGNSALYSMYNVATIKFQSAFAVTAGQNTLTWYIASKYDQVVGNTGSAGSYDLFLCYNASTKLLYFSFSSEGRLFAKQTISTNINLTDGNVHTLVVRLNRTPTVLSGNVAGVIDAVNTPRIVASTIDVYVDGGDAVKAYYPYYNTTNNWVTNNGSPQETGSMITADGITFLSLFNFTAVKTGNNCTLRLYNYDVGYESAGSYASIPMTEDEENHEQYLK